VCPPFAQKNLPDVTGCQKKMAELITDRADYILAVKGNQGNLYGDIRLLFEFAAKNNFEDIPHDSL